MMESEGKIYDPLPSRSFLRSCRNAMSSSGFSYTSRFIRSILVKPSPVKERPHIPQYIFGYDFLRFVRNFSAGMPGIAHAISDMRWGRLAGRSGPLFAPGECISARSVWTRHRALRMSTINSDEHSAKRYVRSGPEQPLAPEQRDKPGVYCISTGNRMGKQAR